MRRSPFRVAQGDRRAAVARKRSNPPDTEQRLDSSLERRKEAARRQGIRLLRMSDPQIAQRRIDPRRPLEGTAGVIRSCGWRLRGRIVLAAATRPSLRRCSAATPCGRGASRRLHAILYHAWFCQCNWDKPCCGNGHQHEERGRDLQDFKLPEHSFHPGDNPSSIVRRHAPTV